jgi:hypothetical protein
LFTVSRKPSTKILMLTHFVLWGGLANLRPIGKSACREEAAGTDSGSALWAAIPDAIPACPTK